MPCLYIFGLSHHCILDVASVTQRYSRTHQELPKYHPHNNCIKAFTPVRSYENSTGSISSSSDLGTLLWLPLWEVYRSVLIRLYVCLPVCYMFVECGKGNFNCPFALRWCKKVNSDWAKRCADQAAAVAINGKASKATSDLTSTVDNMVLGVIAGQARALDYTH